MKHIVLPMIALLAGVVFARAGEPNIRLVHPLGEDAGNTCIDIPCETISRAIDVAAADDIIDVAAGEYTEMLTIDKSLTLQGAGQDNVTIIQAHENNPLSAFGRVITISEEDLEVEISGVVIRHGRALGSFPEKDGGGLFIDAGVLKLNNVTFENNLAFEGTSTGGGMWARGSELELNNTDFVGNRSGMNGGGLNLAFGNLAELTDVSFIGNAAGNLGGGILAGDDGMLTMTNVDLTGNSSNSDGGGMYASGNGSNVTLIDVDFVDNSSGFRGGGLTSFAGSMMLTRVAFEVNSALQGGGMFAAGSGSREVNLDRVTFDGNEAQQGGGMYAEIFSSPVLNTVTFKKNRAVSNPGEMSGTEKGNARPAGDFTILRGGGMFNAGNSTPSLNNVTFTDNSAAFSGGGMHNENSAPVLTDVSFDRNSATIEGGGVANVDDSAAMLFNVHFNENSSDSGGGLSNIESSPELANVTFRGNHAGGPPGCSPVCVVGNGGGMLSQDGSPRLINVVFSGNLAFGGFGGGAKIVRGAPRFTNVTFSGNQAGNRGGGVDLSNGEDPAVVPIIRNSMFWNNRDGTGTGTASGSIGIDGQAGFIAAFSLVQGRLPPGDGNLDGADPDNDPLFLNMPDPESAPTVAGNLRLRPESPAIDAGNDAFVDGVDTDRDGNPRIIDASVDLGPYEFTGEIDDVIFRDRFEQ